MVTEFIKIFLGLPTMSGGSVTIRPLILLLAEESLIIFYTAKPTNVFYLITSR